MHLKREWSLFVLNLLEDYHGNYLTNKNECKTISDAFRNSSDTE